ncbi:MAG: antibiotic biosynthesis monooxygenase family protein [Solirubrobacteraceae bacterium]
MTSAADRKMREDGPITLINVFEVPAEQVDEFIDRWRDRAKIMATAPGFRDSRLHRAVSPQARFQLINVAHWDSEADLDAALDSGAWQERVRALREDPEMPFSANPALYQAVADLSKP